MMFGGDFLFMKFCGQYCLAVQTTGLLLSARIVCGYTCVEGNKHRAIDMFIGYNGDEP